MSMKFYTERENGDLKFVEEVEGTDDPGIALDLLLDEYPKLSDQLFIAIDDDTRVEIEAEDEVIQPRRKITVRGGSSNGSGTAAPKKRGRPKGSTNKPKADDGDEAPKPRRGRPPGSKNKTTGAKRGPGRPKGSKNKTTAASGEAPKRRGRPPGSKNKPKATATGGAPKKRGRPPGSKNKPKAGATGGKKTLKKKSPLSVNSAE